MTPLLQVSGLSMRFGGLLAVNNFELTLNQGEIISLIGPNGGGKTTIFNCLTGFYTPTNGKIIYYKQRLEGLSEHVIARLGVLRTFQHVRLFKEMTVIENLLVAQHKHFKSGIFSGLLNISSFRKTESRAIDNAVKWLERFDLLKFANYQAGTLTYGQQRYLEISRCMVTRPKILMLDEPSAGLNRKETNKLDNLISDIRSQYHVSILLIEHNMKLVMGISDRIYVVNEGTQLTNGTPNQIRQNPDVINAYLGEA
ncbi:Lipopolysaccharide export system ATP-binding protein LptB [Candidatus Hartigia pinicola]|nr:Lipopolysaccharide export system ATP-binding protein LptB [Candidatus Hartigia pinicola]